MGGIDFSAWATRKQVRKLSKSQNMYTFDPPQENPSWFIPPRLIASFSLMSIATLVAVAVGLATNKIIAISVGPEGLAMLGIYRSLSAWAGQALGMGYAFIFVQRLAAARGRSEIGEVFGAALLVTGVQAFIVFLVAALAAPIVAAWIFGPDQSPSQTTPVRVVLGMTFASLLLQMGVSFLRGKAALNSIAAVQFAAAITSLVLVIPLLELGNRGLAILVGAGSVSGACLASFLAWRHYRPVAGEISIDRAWSLLNSTTVDSLLVTIQAVLAPGALLYLQSQLGSTRGMGPLGQYLAGLLVIDTLVISLLSSIRTYLLPALGRADSEPERSRTFSLYLRLSLFVVSAAGVLLILASGPLARALFSDRFYGGGRILSILALSLPGQVLCWAFNTFLLHKDRLKYNVFLDMTFFVAFVAFGSLILKNGYTELAVAWIYSLCYLIWGTLFVAVSVRTFGLTNFGIKDFFFAIACQFVLLACWLATSSLA